MLNSVWDKALQKNVLLYPSEQVVRFMASASQRQTSGGHALDVGFGSGQHLKLFMDYGYYAHGTELLDRAIERGQSLLKGQSLAGSILQGDLDHPELKSDFYSLVVAWGSIFLKPMDGILWNLSKIHDVMVAGGEACINFRNKETWFYKFGNELDTNHYHLDARAGQYQDYDYTFLDQGEVRDLCSQSGFDITNFEKIELWKNNMLERHSWFVVWLRKA